MKITEDIWIIEYWFDGKWKFSGANHYDLFSNEPIGRQFEDTIAIMKSKIAHQLIKYSCSHPYRMRNKCTGDIVPAAML